MDPIKLIGPAFLFAVAAVVTWAYTRKRPSPAEQERQRRFRVNAYGRMVDGFISDLRDGLIFYSYSVGGVDYVATQDLSSLPPALMPDATAILGSATIKYFPRNPANSIVVCETWSGLRSKKERKHLSS